jgi:hypothetical protein
MLVRRSKASFDMSFDMLRVFRMVEEHLPLRHEHFK